jgi:hypothetical protein
MTNLSGGVWIRIFNPIDLQEQERGRAKPGRHCLEYAHGQPLRRAPQVDTVYSTEIEFKRWADSCLLIAWGQRTSWTKS